MSVADWLVRLQEELEEGNSAVCLVTSGDIDAAYINLNVTVNSWYLERKDDGKIKFMRFCRKKGQIMMCTT